MHPSNLLMRELNIDHRVDDKLETSSSASASLPCSPESFDDEADLARDNTDRIFHSSALKPNETKIISNKQKEEEDVDELEQEVGNGEEEEEEDGNEKDANKQHQDDENDDDNGDNKINNNNELLESRIIELLTTTRLTFKQIVNRLQNEQFQGVSIGTIRRINRDNKFRRPRYDSKLTREQRAMLLDELVHQCAGGTMRPNLSQLAKKFGVCHGSIWYWWDKLNKLTCNSNRSRTTSRRQTSAASNSNSNRSTRLTPTVSPKMICPTNNNQISFLNKTTTKRNNKNNIKINDRQQQINEGLDSATTTTDTLDSAASTSLASTSSSDPMMMATSPPSQTSSPSSSSLSSLMSNITSPSVRNGFGPSSEAFKSYKLLGRVEIKLSNRESERSIPLPIVMLSRLKTTERTMDN